MERRLNHIKPAVAAFINNGGFMKLSNVFLVCALFFSGVAFSADQIPLNISDVQVQQYLRYDFGRVWVNSLSYVRYEVTNQSSRVVERRNFTISGHGFEAYTNCPTLMYPGTRCDLEIRFWPPFENRYFGRMQMLFNDNNHITIDLYGEAIR